MSDSTDRGEHVEMDCGHVDRATAPEHWPAENADGEVVRKYGESTQDTYAGSFVHGEPRVVRFTSELAMHEQALRQRMSYPETLAVRVADFSLAELERAFASLSGAADQLAVEGIELSMIDVNEMANRVEVLVSRLTGPTAEILVRRFGSALEIAEGTVEAVNVARPSCSNGRATQRLPNAVARQASGRQD